MKIIYFALYALAMALAEKTGDESLLVRANNQFTAKMFSEVVKTKPSESVVMSAFSVLAPLAQLSFAAEGSSHDELLEALSMPHDNATRREFLNIKNTLRSIKGIDLKMASRIFVLNGYEMVDEFQGLSRDIFGSDVKNVNFVKNVETAHEINEWVEEQTNHRIKDLITPDSLDESTRAVLANAIYFKGTWKYPFNKKFTADSDFYISAEKTIKVPMMSIFGEYELEYSKELNAKLLRIPYEGDEASMLFVLPRKLDGLKELEEKLKNPNALKDVSRDMSTSECEVMIPKFKIETSIDLQDVLLKINVTKIFDSNNAHLNKILKGLRDVLFVSEARQKAFIEVNEEGAVAATANEFGLSNRSLRDEYYADHPFYFEIQVKENSRSGEYITLFSGVYQS